MEENRNSFAGESPGSLPQDSSRLSSKLRDKLDKLGRWRIQQPSIDFPTDGREFHGGYASVSRAALLLPSNVQGKCKDFVEGESGEVQGDVSKHLERQPSTFKRKIVAVKKMKIERNTDVERVLGLALRESEFVIELPHPNIVKLEGFVEDVANNVVWLVFPWEENGNLRDFLASGEWEIPERISLINDVGVGLEYLHSRKPAICHGDLKSLNVLVNSEWRAMITDFGSARRLDSEAIDKQMKKYENEPPPALEPDTAKDQENTQLQAIFCATTNTITLTGNSYTIRWAAPELLKDEPPGLGSDIWAFGWIAYEVMTNTIPFHDVKSENIVVNRVVQGDLPSITTDARMSLIRALCSLMVQCWSIVPERRPKAEDCRKSITWMPKITPAPRQTIDTDVSQTRNAQLLHELGDMYERQSDYINALDCFTKALDIQTSALNLTQKARALCALARLHLRKGDYDDAASFCSEALQIYTAANERSNRADALFHLAEIRRAQDALSDSIDLYSESLQIYTDIGEGRGRALTLWGLATVCVRRGQYDQARAFYSEALQINTEIGEQREVAMTQRGLADIHRLEGGFTEAIRLYSESLETFANVGDQRESAITLSDVGNVRKLQGDYSGAIEHYTEALRINREIGNKGEIPYNLQCLHEIRCEWKRDKEAIARFPEASEAYGEGGDSGNVASAPSQADALRESLERAV